MVRISDGIEIEFVEYENETYCVGCLPGEAYKWSGAIIPIEGRTEHLPQCSNCGSIDDQVLRG